MAWKDARQESAHLRMCWVQAHMPQLINAIKNGDWKHARMLADSIEQECRLTRWWMEDLSDESERDNKFRVSFDANGSPV